MVMVMTMRREAQYKGRTVAAVEHLTFYCSIPAYQAPDLYTDNQGMKGSSSRRGSGRAGGQLKYERLRTHHHYYHH